MDAIELIRAERLRQIEQEGYEPQHDEALYQGELANAAAAYAATENVREHYAHKWSHDISICPVPTWWPFEVRYWRPTPGDRVRELVKAGALIVAEIERLQRLDSE